ncbi:MAG: RNA-binding protein [Hyphomonas sp.]|nr:RNA-binding protein [Hyphomonas sp.]
MTEPHPKTDARVTGTEGQTADGSEASVRQCAVTRERLGKDGLVRFVLSPDGVVTPDIAEKLPGRGVWVTADRAVLAEAVKKNAFARAFKSSVTVPDGLADTVERLLVQRFTGLLGMAKKAGDVVLGYDQVRDALQKRPPGLLLEAADGAEDGRTKVYFLAKALYSGVDVAGALSAAELGMAFGRDRVIHGLVRKGPFAKSLAAAYARLSGFRDRPELDWFQDQDR